MNFQGFAAYKMAVAEQKSLLQLVDYLINSPDCVWCFSDDYVNLDTRLSY